MHHMRNQGPIAEIKRLPERIRPALVLLFEAAEYAQETSGKLWEFAVEIEQLRSLGLQLNDFRWLVRNALVLHQHELTLEGDDGRSFRSSGDLTFTDRTCFVLSEMGLQLALGIDNTNSEAFAAHGSRHKMEELTMPSNGHNGTLPKWDSVRHELRWNGNLVKRFKHRSPNQEAILAAFQEEGWPVRVDDPLSPAEDMDPKRRLNDTIKGLNHHQAERLLRFRGDGTGEGIIWERNS